MVIDSHCHLNPEYYDEDGIIQLLSQGDLAACVTMGCTCEESQFAVDLASKFDNVYACVGIHPENVAVFEDEKTINRLRELAKSPKVVAVGEVGLDYHYESSLENHMRQKQVLLAQIELADELGLPIVLHCRDAVSDLFELLSANRNKLSHGFVLHCFSEKSEWVEKFLALGAYFSFAGNSTYKNFDLASVEKVPEDRIMVETDSPYLSPVPKRGQKNEPVNAQITGKFIANIRGKMWEEFEDILLKNTKRFFGIG